VQVNSRQVIIEIILSVDAQEPSEWTLEKSLLFHELVFGFLFSSWPRVWCKTAPSWLILALFVVIVAPAFGPVLLVLGRAHVLEE